MGSKLHVNTESVVDIAHHDFITQAISFISSQKRGGDSDHDTVIVGARTKALEKLKTTGIPSTRHEDWKYTDLNHILNKNFTLSYNKAESCSEKIENIVNNYIANDISKELGLTDVVVLINGVFNAKLSVVDNSRVSVSSITDYLLANNMAAASNFEDMFTKTTSYGKPYETDGIESYINACWHDGVAVNIPGNQKSAVKIRVLNIFTDTVSNKIINNKNIYNVSEASEVNITEEYLNIIGDSIVSDAFVSGDNNDVKFSLNLLVDVNLGVNSICRHYLLQNHTSHVYHVGHYNIIQDKGSKYHSFNINLGALLSRQNINVLQNDHNAECYLNGAFLPKGNQHMDSHLKVFHNSSNGISTQDYRGVLGQRGHGVFNGMVYVAHGTLNNNAMQSNKNVLLSKHAEVDTKPELEIYSEDVVCSHGATIGKLDENALFYLRSRGISELDAMHILISSFVNHIIDKINDNDILSWLENKMILALEHITQKS